MQSSIKSPSLPKSSLLKSKLFWVSLLYFSEGLPLGLFYDLFPVYFRQQGVELSKIGLLSLLGLAWSIKFLWAPLIDFTRNHRYWMAAADVGMGLVMMYFAMHAGFGSGVWIAIGIFTLLSATNDIAIDGYTIERLDKREYGMANGFRIGFYRVGMLTAGALLWFSDVAGWTATHWLSCAIFGGMAIMSLTAPKEAPRSSENAPISVNKEMRFLLDSPSLMISLAMFVLALLWPILNALDVAAIKELKAFWWFKAIPIALILLAAFVFKYGFQRISEVNLNSVKNGPVFGALISLLNRKHAFVIICFILIFKLADSSIGFMIKPFWVDSGFTNTQIGMISVNVGLALSIAGGVLGGWYTDKVGIFKGLWLLGLTQAFSNLGYVVAAMVIPPAAQGVDIAVSHQAIMYSASAIESFTQGLGTGAFLAFMMAIVDKSKATTEYAILSSIFAFSRSIAGWAGGVGAQEMGYANYFMLTFLLAFPAYLMLPWIKKVLLNAEQTDSGIK
jgi:PAT family beta-lactamase induction signal transducer AmpG